MNRSPLFLLAAWLLAAPALRSAPLFFEPKSPNLRCVFSLPDTLPPAINCPPSDTVALAPGLCSMVYTYSVVAYDDQPGHVLSQTEGLASGATFPIGKTVNRFVVTDAAGNTASCSFFVEIRHFETPLNCHDTQQFTLGANCQRLILPSEVLSNTQLGCPNMYEVSLDRQAPYGNGPWGTPALLSASDHGKYMGIRVRDTQNGNACWGTISVQDNTPPTLNCPDLTVSCLALSRFPDYLRDSLGIANAVPTLADNCGTVMFAAPKPLWLSTSPLACDSAFIYTSTLRWTAIDGAQNTATCLQTIRYTPVALAEVQIPADVSLSCESQYPLPALTGKPFVQIGNVRFDDLCAVGYNYEDLFVLPCGGSRRIQRKWTIIDWCENAELVHYQYIDQLDRAAPTMDCPQNMTVSLGATGCQAAVDLPDAVVSDACSPLAGLTAFWSPTDSLAAALSDFPANDPAEKDTLAVLGLAQNLAVGANTIRYRATDECGNRSECQFQLTVWDSVPPLAQCQNLRHVVLGIDGKATLSAAALDAGSADACLPTLAFKARRAVANGCQPNDFFHDQLVFCCADAGDTVAVVLRAYDVILPAGAVSPMLAEGQASSCTTLVAVTDTLPVRCVAPPDVVVSCQNFDPTLAAYDAGLSQTCVAGQPIPSVDYGLFNVACQAGRIVRTWRVWDASGTTSECTQRIDVQLDTAAMRQFFVRFPDDQVAFPCPANSIEWGEPLVAGNICAGLKIEYEDALLTVVPDACFKIERTWTVKNECIAAGAAPHFVQNPQPSAQPNASQNLVGPVVSAPGTTGAWAPTVAPLTASGQPHDFGTDWNQSAGGYRYRQIIKVIDNEDPVLAGCPAAATHFRDSVGPNEGLLWNNLALPAQPDGSHDLPELAIEGFMQASDACTYIRPVPMSVAISYRLFLDLTGDGTMETVVWAGTASQNNTLPGAVRFNNYQTPNYMGGTALAFDSRPLPDSAKYQFALQRTDVGDITTFRVAWNTQAAPDVFVPMQLPHGKHRIFWTVEDACGNKTLCDRTFTIGPASAPAYHFGGRILTEEGSGVAGVMARLESTPIGATTPTVSTATSDAAGRYDIAQPVLPLSDCRLVPMRDDNPLNGVSTFDMLLISKHILGSDTLESPYKLLAADVNRSGSVTSFDVLEIRKLVLGVNNEFSNSASWRFVAANWVFADPLNPFQAAYPEAFVRYDITSHFPDLDFVGIKVGDVNGSAAAHFSAETDERRAAEPCLFFETDDRHFEPGEVFQAWFEPTTAEAEAWQFTLEHAGLDALEILPGKNAAADQFAIFPKEKTITAAAIGAAAGEGFGLIFKALQRGSLAENLRFTGRIAPEEATLASGARGGAGLRFRAKNASAAASSALEIHAAQPNPFADATELRFWLPAPAALRLRVFDELGNVLIFKTLEGAAGENRARLDFGGLPATGVFVCKIETEMGSATTRLMRGK